MLIETYIKEVPGKGLGLFTKHDLQNGQIIYEDCDLFSKTFTLEMFNSLNTSQKKFIKTYGCYVEEKQWWYLDTDDGRFINHSETPNISYDWGTYLQGGKGAMKALTNIPAGTELCSNYRLHSDQFKDTLLY